MISFILVLLWSTFTYASEKSQEETQYRRWTQENWFEKQLFDGLDIAGLSKCKSCVRLFCEESGAAFFEEVLDEENELWKLCKNDAPNAEQKRRFLQYLLYKIKSESCEKY